MHAPGLLPGVIDIALLRSEKYPLNLDTPILKGQRWKNILHSTKMTFTSAALTFLKSLLKVAGVPA